MIFFPSSSLGFFKPIFVLLYISLLTIFFFFLKKIHFLKKKDKNKKRVIRQLRWATIFAEKFSFQERASFSTRLPSFVSPSTVRYLAPQETGSLRPSSRSFDVLSGPSSFFPILRRSFRSFVISSEQWPPSTPIRPDGSFNCSSQPPRSPQIGPRALPFDANWPPLVAAHHCQPPPPPAEKPKLQPPTIRGLRRPHRRLRPQYLTCLLCSIHAHRHQPSKAKTPLALHLKLSSQLTSKNDEEQEYMAKFHTLIRWVA